MQEARKGGEVSCALTACVRACVSACSPVAAAQAAGFGSKLPACTRPIIMGVAHWTAEIRYIQPVQITVTMTDSVAHGMRAPDCTIKPRGAPHTRSFERKLRG